MCISLRHISLHVFNAALKILPMHAHHRKRCQQLQWQDLFPFECDSAAGT